MRNGRINVFFASSVTAMFPASPGCVLVGLILGIEDIDTLEPLLGCELVSILLLALLPLMLSFSAWLAVGRASTMNITTATRPRRTRLVRRTATALIGFSLRSECKTTLVINGAEEGIRTPTVLLPPAPQAGASASFATSAFRGVI